MILQVDSAKGRSSLISKAIEDGKITGVPTSANGLKLSHLLFAYDSLLFCRSFSGVE
jgi:hypothetical protein